MGRINGGFWWVSGFFLLFFVQSVGSAVGVIRLSVSSGTKTYLGVGPSPPALVESLRRGTFDSQREILQALLTLTSRLYRENDDHIAQLAKKRDSMMNWNLSSVTWLLVAVIIYTQAVVNWL